LGDGEREPEYGFDAGITLWRLFAEQAVGSFEAADAVADQAAVVIAEVGGSSEKIPVLYAPTSPV